MSNTDNTQPQAAERRQLAKALHLPDGLPFASLIAGAEEQRIDLAAVRAAHESRRRTLSWVLNLGTSAPWDAITERAQEVASRLADYENRITWETTCGEHAQLLDSCRKADERATTAEAALTRVRNAAQLHRQGLIEYTELYAAIDGPMDPVHILGAEPNSTRGGDQPAESQPDDGDRVVAYVSIYRPGLLYCRTCAGDRAGLRPVTSEDLPDGGICYSCGVDVLAEAQPERCGQYAGHGEYCDYPREPGGELCAVHSAEQVRVQPEPKRSGIFAGVQGHCPACGRTALILGTGGYVTCGNLDCPQPDAATTLLERDVREQPAEPELRGPSADAAPHIAFAISSYLAALVPLADALRDALGEQR